jgi:hypothetical protein
MTTQDDSWTGAWVANKILDHDQVSKVEVVGPRLLHVVRKKHPDVMVATVAIEKLTLRVLRDVLVDVKQVDFVTNVPNSAFTDGNAIKFASAWQFSIGGMKDLYRALNERDVAAYVNPGVAFIERGLRQHSRVVDFTRLADSKYMVARRERSDVYVVFLNEYELTADHVRSAKDKYGSFTMLVNTNPNGGGRPPTRVR